MINLNVVIGRLSVLAAFCTANGGFPIAVIADEDLPVSSQAPQDGDFHLLLLNPRRHSSEVGSALLSPFDCAFNINGMRQLVQLSSSDASIEFYWVEVRPRRFDRSAMQQYVERQSISEGQLRTLFDLSKGRVEDSVDDFEWFRKPPVIGGNRVAVRAGHKEAALMSHALFISLPPSRHRVDPLRYGVLGYGLGDQSLPERLEFVMATPAAWQPIIKSYFESRKTVADASPRVLVESLVNAKGVAAGDELLKEVFMLLRLAQVKLAASERTALATLSHRKNTDLILDSLWLSQWTIALLANESPDDLGKRLDKLADAEIAMDDRVSQQVFMMLVAHMASYLDVTDSPVVPFTPAKKPDAVAGAFFVARVNHIRDAIAKLPKDSLSVWGKSIANYEFMPPYAPWPPEPTKVSSPKD